MEERDKDISLPFTTDIRTVGATRISVLTSTSRPAETLMSERVFPEITSSKPSQLQSVIEEIKHTETVETAEILIPADEIESEETFTSGVTAVPVLDRFEEATAIITEEKEVVKSRREQQPTDMVYKIETLPMLLLSHSDVHTIVPEETTLVNKYISL